MTVLKILRLSVAVIAILFYSTGCKKETVRPQRKEFNIVYRFINEGDANVKAVFFSSTTFYPNDTVDRTGDSISVVYWTDQVFDNVGQYGVIMAPMVKKGYIGCTAGLKLTVRLKEPMFSQVYADKGYGGYNGVYPVGMTAARAYIGITKTIASPEDSIITFRWPSDTLKCQEVLFY